MSLSYVLVAALLVLALTNIALVRQRILDRRLADARHKALENGLKPLRPSPQDSSDQNSPEGSAPQPEDDSSLFSILHALHQHMIAHETRLDQVKTELSALAARFDRLHGEVRQLSAEHAAIQASLEETGPLFRGMASLHQTQMQAVNRIYVSLSSQVAAQEMLRATTQKHNQLLQALQNDLNAAHDGRHRLPPPSPSTDALLERVQALHDKIDALAKKDDDSLAEYLLALHDKIDALRCDRGMPPDQTHAIDAQPAKLLPLVDLDRVRWYRENAGKVALLAARKSEAADFIAEALDYLERCIHRQSTAIAGLRQRESKRGEDKTPPRNGPLPPDQRGDPPLNASPSEDREEGSEKSADHQAAPPAAHSRKRASGKGG